MSQNASYDLIRFDSIPVNIISSQGGNEISEDTVTMNEAVSEYPTVWVPYLTVLGKSLSKMSMSTFKLHRDQNKRVRGG